MKNGLFCLFASSLLFASGLHAAEISLLDLPVLEYKVGFADLWFGKNVDNRTVMLHGKETEDYIFAHAPSRVLYAIPAGVTSFQAWGVRTHGDSNVVGTWVYIVKIDDKEVFRSEPLEHYQNHEVPISVGIPAGAKIIELVIDDLTNNYADHSIWAAPTFR